MTTTDIVINNDGDWHEIPSGKLYVWITYVRYNNLLVRVGPGDTSGGIEIYDGPVQLKADTSLFVKFKTGDASERRGSTTVTVVTA